MPNSITSLNETPIRSLSACGLDVAPVMNTGNTCDSKILDYTIKIW